MATRRRKTRKKTRTARRTPTAGSRRAIKRAAKKEARKAAQRAVKKAHKFRLKQIKVQAKAMKKPSSKQERDQKTKYPILTSRLRKWITVVLLASAGLIIAFSFFDQASTGGNLIFRSFNSLIGRTVFFVPLLLVFFAFLLIKPQKKRIVAPVFVALSLILIGLSGIFSTNNFVDKSGGWLGYIAAWPFSNYVNSTIGFIVFGVFIIIGSLILWEFLPKKRKFEKKKAGQEPLLPVQDKEKIKPKLEVKTIELPEKKKEPVDKEEKNKPETVVGAGALPKEALSYQRPLLSFLDSNQEKPASGDIDYNAAVIKKTFLNFGIDVEMDEINIGPTVTQYTFKPAEGVKLSKITTLNNDLALALAAHPIRIEAPIPGKSLVGVEVPNRIRAKIKIGSLISSDDFQKNPYHLTFALGTDVMGRSILPNLDRMPHLLVAGATGTGKTICLNAIILSLIYRNSPKIMRLILIDPKRVEFPVYSSLPHLLTPVILNSKKAVNALNWLVGEMERRFEVLQEFGARDILSYNQSLEKKPKKRQEGFEIMPYIVVVIDELADLMMSRGKEVEAAIVRLSQLARAVGVHLVVATQRPSVEIITGLIKANITSRIAFQVASQIDSRTILDASGAEKLLGRGDMLFISAEFSKPKRIQGSFVTTPETRKAVDYIAKENNFENQEEITEEETGAAGVSSTTFSLSQGDDIANFSATDELYDEAREIVLQYQKASASLLQRRLHIGYARAARILDSLEENGIVGPQEGSRPRTILISQEDPIEAKLNQSPPANKHLDQPDNDNFIDAGKVEPEYK